MLPCDNPESAFDELCYVSWRETHRAGSSGYFLAHTFIPLNAPNPHKLPSRIAKDDEHLLVAAAKKGDTTAFEELVSRYERKIFRVTMNITRNQEDAEDSMQDAFFKAYSHLKDFSGDSRFYTWLVRIAANEALMRLRKRRPNVISLDEPIEGEDDLMPREIEDWGPNPLQRFAQTEMNEILTAPSILWLPISALFSSCATSRNFLRKKPLNLWASPFPR